jgi:Flp pilus assembly pilin Flp
MMTVHDIMNFSETKYYRPKQKKTIALAAGRNRGAVALEYALCMVVAAVLMFGVERMFSNMAQEIINRFKNIVLSFPNI